jgi:endonuclease YncB( thermonuclease family)
MRMYICTSPRMQFRKTLIAGFGTFLVAASFLSLPSTAQSARTPGSAAQANLRITVNVVPAVASHRHRDKDRDGDAIAYDLMPRDEHLSITREIRLMSIEGQGDGSQKQPVQLTTVVAK